MKKTRYSALALAVVLCLCLPYAAALGEEDSNMIEFTPSLANSFDYTQTKWYSTAENRALLALLMAIDLMDVIDVDDDEPNIFKTSFVGKRDTGLTIVLQSDSDKAIIVAYLPMASRAAYTIQGNSGSDALTELYAAAISNGGYEKTDPDEVLEWVTALLDN